MRNTFKIPQMKTSKGFCMTGKPSGGVNLKQDASLIGDTQSPSMLKMWMRGGALTLRPGCCKKIQQQYGKIVDVYPRDGRTLLLKCITKGGTLVQERRGIYIATQKAVITYDGNTVERVPTYIDYGDSGWEYSYDDLSLDKAVFLPSAGADYEQQDSAALTWQATGDVVYLCGSGNFLIVSPQVVVPFYNIMQKHVTADYELFSPEPYVPVIYTNCTADGTGTKNEARNFLTGQCTQQFTTDGTNTVYHLADTSIDDNDVDIACTMGDGIKLNYHFGQGDTQSGVTSPTAILDRTKGTITFSTQLVNAQPLRKTNNLSITYYKTVYNDIPIYNCSAGEWLAQSRVKSAGAGCSFPVTVRTRIMSITARRMTRHIFRMTTS